MVRNGILVILRVFCDIALWRTFLLAQRISVQLATSGHIQVPVLFGFSMYSVTDMLLKLGLSIVLILLSLIHLCTLKPGRNLYVCNN